MPDQDNDKTDNDAVENELDADDLASWEALEPADDFAERVLAARVRSVATTTLPTAAATPFSDRRWKFGAAVVTVACAAVVLFALSSGPSLPGAIGHVAVDERTTVKIGHRGVAVAEPGARIDWRISPDGTAEVDQTAGDVFYRVDGAKKFTVDTAMGRIEATGTCFRVEVREMKAPKAGLMGVAAGAVLVISVYEGSVLFADKSGDEKRVAVGETLAVDQAGKKHVVAAGDVAVQAPKPFEKPPALDVTRDELLRRDEQLRAQLAELKDKAKAMRRDLAAARLAKRNGEDGDGRPWFDPSPDTLRKFADECRVRYDAPHVLGDEPMNVSEAMARRYGLEGDERGALNSALASLHGEWMAMVRKLYIEATGDTRSAESLSAKAMASEIRDKSMPGEMGRVQQRLARERAGMLPPPNDLSRTSPLERYYRALSKIGDEMETRLGAQIGTERARALREHNNGWGMRMEIAGCPDDDQNTENVED